MRTLSTWHTLEAKALAVTQVTRSHSASVCQLIESSISLLVKGLLSAYPQPSNDQNKVTAGLLSSNINALTCSHVLAQQGYYVQSIAQLRNVYENWIAIQYLTVKPTSANLWLSPTRKAPGHKEMLEAISWEADDDLKDKAKELYHLLCRFAHTSFVHVLSNVGNKGTNICFGPHYDESSFRNYAFLSSFLIEFTIDKVAIKVNPDQPWHADRERLLVELESFIDEENRRFGQQGSPLAAVDAPDGEHCVGNEPIKEGEQGVKNVE